MVLRPLSGGDASPLAVSLSLGLPLAPVRLWKVMDSADWIREGSLYHRQELDTRYDLSPIAEGPEVQVTWRPCFWPSGQQYRCDPSLGTGAQGLGHCSPTGGLTWAAAPWS